MNMQDIIQWRTSVLSYLTPSTVDVYADGINEFASYLGVRPYSAITPGVMQAFVTHLKGKGFMPATIAVKVSATMSFLKWLHGERKMAAMPDKPRCPPVGKYIQPVVMEDVLATYIAVAREVREPYSTALLLLPFCGLRVSEMCQLRLEDISVRPPWGFVLKVGSDHRQGQNTKGHKERMVPMIPAGSVFLKRYLRDTRPHLGDSVWLFPAVDSLRPDEHISSKGMQQTMRKIRGKVGLNNLTPHTLRHTFKRLLEEGGVHGLKIAELMGHSSLSTTAGYGRPTARDLEGVVSKLTVGMAAREEDNSGE